MRDANANLPGEDATVTVCFGRNTAASARPGEAPEARAAGGVARPASLGEARAACGVAAPASRPGEASGARAACGVAAPASRPGGKKKGAACADAGFRRAGDSGRAATGSGKARGTSQGRALSLKDLMNVGIFTALNMAVGIAIAVPVGLIPIGLLSLSVIAPIVGGIVGMLFITKIKKPGMLFIMSLINGLMLLFTGMGVYPLLIGCVASLAAEGVLRAGRYKSAWLSVVAYATSSIAVMGNYVQWAVSGQDYVDKIAAGYGREFAQTVAGYFADPRIYGVLVVVCFASGLVGGVLGRAVFKKHFERAGIV